MKAASHLLSKLHQSLIQYSCGYASSRTSNFTARFTARPKLTQKKSKPVDEFTLQKVTDYLRKKSLSETEISAIPDSFIRRTNKPSHFVLVDRKVAKLIALTICSRASGELFLEYDAGIGLVSELLQQLTQNLRLYVSNPQLVEHLEEKFQDTLNKKVKVFDRSFTNLISMLYARIENIDAISKLFVGLPQKPWTEDIPLSMITPITHIKFMKSFVVTLVKENSIKQFGRPEFFFLLPNNLAEHLLFQEKCSIGNLSIHFLFNIFFDVEILLKDLPREAFLPWTSASIKRKMSDNNLYLVHAIPKLKRFEPYLDRQFLDLLITFVRSALRHKKRIIPIFESLVPYCGSRFIIEDDIDVYTEFHEVSPEKLYTLFKKLTSYPEFDQKMLERSEIMEDGDTDFNNEETTDDLNRTPQTFEKPSEF